MAANTDRFELVGSLSQEFIASPLDLILQRCPEWDRLEQTRLIPHGGSRILKNLHSVNRKERRTVFCKDENVPRALFMACRIQNDSHALQYALTCIYQIVRDDSLCYDVMIDLLRGEDIYSPFIAILEKKENPQINDLAAFLLSGIISRAKSRMFEEQQIETFVKRLVRGSYGLSDSGQLEAIANILKLPTCREMCWKTSTFPQLVKKSLYSSKGVRELYSAVFCCWLLSFSPDCVHQMVAVGLMQQVCEVLKGCKVEKVVRLAARVLVNASKNDEATEIIIEQNCLQVLTLLEYEKWRDQDTYHELQGSLAALQAKIRQFSNFHRYKHEIMTGSLKWSFLHSEKFWHENVMQFEDNEFEVIKTLVELLTTPEVSSTTLAVACHDLGEFARLHPTGKRILSKLQVKPIVLVLMSHQKREVCCEALLCTQKLMLDRWQDVAVEPTVAHRA